MKGRDLREGLLSDFKETSGDAGRVHYLDCGDSFTGVSLCRNVSEHMLPVCLLQTTYSLKRLLWQVWEVPYWNFDPEFSSSLVPIAFFVSVLANSKFLIHNLMQDLTMVQCFWTCSGVSLTRPPPSDHCVLMSQPKVALTIHPSLSISDFKHFWSHLFTRLEIWWESRFLGP